MGLAAARDPVRRRSPARTPLLLGAGGAALAAALPAARPAPQRLLGLLPLPARDRPPLPRVRRPARHARPADGRLGGRAVLQRLRRAHRGPGAIAVCRVAGRRAPRSPTVVGPAPAHPRRVVGASASPSSGWRATCPPCPRFDPEAGPQHGQLACAACRPCSTTIVAGVREDLADAQAATSLAERRAARCRRARALDAEAALRRPGCRSSPRSSGPARARAPSPTIPDPAALARTTRPAVPPRSACSPSGAGSAARSTTSTPCARRCGSRCCARTSSSSDYQVCEARAHGADLILLIVAALAAGRPRPACTARSASSA